MAETIRSFVAIELSPTVLATLTQIMANLKGQLPRGALRWVQPGGIHLTLQFLGDVRAEQVQAITQALGRAAATVPPFTLQ
ncbi:MAG: RNA 2',3'-cyclic phosphodiesterase, partial [Chloroflexi bacterium]|nr:RNA 2',3'-cyclic phosphodiesterase [Chloroflexota bacterium]